MFNYMFKMKLTGISTIVSFTLLWVTPGLRADDKCSSSILMNQLASSDYEEATKAVTDLYAQSEKAIPCIISGFKDTRLFHGDCGSSQHHPVWKFYPADNIQTPMPTEQEFIAVQIREVCLYLLLAIRKQNLYHAKTCQLVSEERDKELALSGVLAEISAIYENSMKDPDCKSNLLSIEKIMSKYKVKFD